MTQQILLTKGYFALVDDDDYERVNQYKWCYCKGYAIRGIGDKKHWRNYPLHRYIIDPPLCFDVDHINKDKLDNRQCNLRLASRSQNCANSGPRAGTSKYKGVCWIKARNCWKASIRISGQYKTLGQFNNEIDAALAYDKAAFETWSEFAYINFPEQLR